MRVAKLSQVVTNQLKNETYVLYQCGTPDPSTLTPLPAGAKVFQIPLQSVSVADSTANNFLVRA